MSRIKKYKVIDLFSGAGGFGSGVQYVGPGYIIVTLPFDPSMQCQEVAQKKAAQTPTSGPYTITSSPSNGAVFISTVGFGETPFLPWFNLMGKGNDVKFCLPA